MKQKRFKLGLNSKLFTIEPDEKVRQFGKRLHDAMKPIRREIRKKLKQSEIDASKRIVF
jgi:hypothetical protein